MFRNIIRYGFQGGVIGLCAEHVMGQIGWPWLVGVGILVSINCALNMWAEAE